MRIHECSLPAIARRYNLTEDFLVHWILLYFCPSSMRAVVEQPYTQSHNIYSHYKMPMCQIVYFHRDLPKHRSLEARQVEGAKMTQH